MSLTSLASSVPRVGVHACFPPSPLFPGTGSVQPILNNYLQRRGSGGGPAQQILHFCLLGAADRGPLLIQPSLLTRPANLCGYESMIRQDKGTLARGEEDSAGLSALMPLLLHPEYMKEHGRERKNYKRAKEENVIFL